MTRQRVPNPTARAILAVLAFCFGGLTIAFGALSVVGGAVGIGWIATTIGLILFVSGTAGFALLRRNYGELWGTSPEDDESHARSRLG